MKHLPTLRDDRATPESTPSDVFLETSRDEESRFLESVRAAGATALDQPGQLALVAASHTENTHEALDRPGAPRRQTPAVG